MLSREIRKKFLKYFEDKGHALVKSSPVVPHDDPTLLFINAGMNQFKDAFLGNSQRDYTRASSSQKCIRVGGKHNDLDNVGHTKRHLTFFEMLGNFSFGDYFKAEAIEFSWEVSTEVFGLDPEKIWPTVFTTDDEAYELWKKYVPEERITRFGEKDNFWAMGDTGPCGPCSELLYDRGEAYGTATTPLEDESGERFLEFWNLVFMQYNRQEDGMMEPLPKPSVDTGAGLERVVSLKMDVDNVFATDILRDIITGIEEVSGLEYSLASESAPAFHVIADHIRSLSFAIADGVQPSNVDRGYVLRKILRRAVRYARTLGINKPFMAQLLPRLISNMGEDYPELVDSRERIIEILTIEEESFIRTLKRGGDLLNNIIEESKKCDNIISGEDAFKLKDTYGFPIEEILLIAKDLNLKVDEDRYRELNEEARQRSRQAHKSVGQKVVTDDIYADYLEKKGSVKFDGYDKFSIEANVTAIVKDGLFVDSIVAGEEASIIIDKTVFYSEKGGQVGDSGLLKASGMEFFVIDCQEPYKGVTTHIGKVGEGVLHIGDKVQAEVYDERRHKIMANHTATHILHWALEKILGKHVRQAGSVVDVEHLRFDFSHHKALTDEEIRLVEDMVNGKIRQNFPVSCYELSYAEAQKDSGIKQFFGDKYGSTVRVVDAEFSKELCGGTHVDRIGDIGYFRIAKESSIAAGIRRIEAITGSAAENFARGYENDIRSMSAKLKTTPAKLIERLDKVLEENKEQGRQIKEAQKGQLGIVVGDLLKEKIFVKEIPVVIGSVSVDPKSFKEVADNIMGRDFDGLLVLANVDGERCQLLSRAGSNAIEGGLKANDILQEIAPLLGCRGGGKANGAQAGGGRSESLSEALQKAREWAQEKIS